jgi:hypothetical protein
MLDLQTFKTQSVARYLMLTDGQFSDSCLGGIVQEIGSVKCQSHPSVIVGYFQTAEIFLVCS